MKKPRTIYPATPLTAVEQDLKNQDTNESRFALAAKRVTTRHGGRPVATIEDGRIVFTYPDGTRTSGGRRIS